MTDTPWICTRCKAQMGTVHKNASGSHVLLIEQAAVKIQLDSGTVVCTNCGAKRKFVPDPRRLMELLNRGKGQ